jgi:signal transduction histidine kinase
MSSLDNIYQKMVPTLEPATLAQLHHESPQPAPNHIGREVAHELNNILTIIQGYADRIMMKHGGDPALGADLKLISNNARRAVAVIRDARKGTAAKSLG